MKSKYLFTFAVTFSTAAFGQSELSNACVEKASYRIIEMMEQYEPKSDFHLVKDSSGLVIGLADSEEIYSNYDLTDASVSKSSGQVVFHSGDSITYAVVDVGTTKKECKIVSVDMGQDDHD